MMCWNLNLHFWAPNGETEIRKLGFTMLCQALIKLRCRATAAQWPWTQQRSQPENDFVNTGITGPKLNTVVPDSGSTPLEISGAKTSGFIQWHQRCLGCFQKWRDSGEEVWRDETVCADEMFVHLIKLTCNILFYGTSKCIWNTKSDISVFV